MMPETVLKKTVMKHLIDTFGNIDAERFISLIIREPFDYTKWQRDLFKDKSVDELFDEMKQNEEYSC